MKITSLALWAAGAWIGCGDVVDRIPDAAPDASTTTTFTFTNFQGSAPGNTELVALQDGDGPFVVLTGTMGVYTAELESERFGLLTACADVTGSALVSVLYAGVSDATSWFATGCSPPTTTVTISGAITGAGSDAVSVLFDFAEVDVPAPATSYSMPVRPGPGKLIASQLVADRPTKLVMVDTVAANGRIVNIDFGTGFVPLTRSIAQDPNISGGSMTYRDVNSFVRFDRLAPPFTNYVAIPSNRLGNGLNRLVLSTTQTDGAQTTIKYFTNPVDQTVTFLPLVQVAQPAALLPGPYPRVATSVRRVPDATLYDMFASTSSDTGDAFRQWSLLVMPGWLAATPGTDVAFAMPDFSGLAGWRAAYQLHDATRLGWSASVTKSVDVLQPFTYRPDQFAFRDGSVTQISNIGGEFAP